MYSVKPISATRQAAAVQEISQELGDWRAELSRFLDVDIVSTSLFLPIFQRQRNVLNMTYWHAIILTHRPYILRSYAHHSQPNQKDANCLHHDQNLKKCLDAAMMTVNTISEITESRQLFRAFWVCLSIPLLNHANGIQNTAYFAFGATIMLYIYVIQECASSPEIYSDYFAAASRCQSHISAIAEKGSLSERYSLVLEELRVEALRQTKRMHPRKPVQRNISSQQTEGVQSIFGPVDENPATVATSTDLTDHVMDLNGNIPGLCSDYSGWGQFTSMVSSGLGNMDMFMNYDSINF